MAARGNGYAECIMQFDDRQGWFPIYVEASPLEDLILNYTPREHGKLADYIARNTDRLPQRTVENLPDEARPSRHDIGHDYQTTDHAGVGVGAHS